MQEKGILPPDKPRLNRKKFVKEVLEEYKQDLEGYDAIFYLNRAIAVFLAGEKFTPEQVGVAKVLKIAVGTKKYMDDLKKQGKKEYNLMEYFDIVVNPVLRL